MFLIKSVNPKSKAAEKRITPLSPQEKSRYKKKNGKRIRIVGRISWIINWLRDWRTISISSSSSFRFKILWINLLCINFNLLFFNDKIIFTNFNRYYLY